MHNSSREQTSGMRSDDRGAFRDCPGGQDQRIGWEIDHVEAVGKRSEEGEGVSRDHHRLEEKVKWPSEVAPKQNGEKWRLSLRGARPGHAAGRGPELGRDRRGPARGPLRRRRPAPDPHDQARSQDGQGAQPLSHRLARAEVADHLCRERAGANGSRRPAGHRRNTGRPGCDLQVDGVLPARVGDHEGGSDPLRRRWGALDLEPGRDDASSVRHQTGPDRRGGGLLPCGGPSGQDRGLTAAVDRAGASEVDSTPATTPPERASRRGPGGYRRGVWPPREPGIEARAQLLQAGRGSEADGLRTDRGVEAADRQWRDREYDPTCGEPAVEGGEYLLAQEERRSGTVVAIVLQGGTLEAS